MIKKLNWKNLLLMQLVFFEYALVGFFSKNAAAHEFLSFSYLKWYCGSIIVLGIYALAWQQALKRTPLTIAYANKAVVVIWGSLLGFLFWHESISVGKIIGLAIIICGIIFVVGGEKNDQ